MFRNRLSKFLCRYGLVTTIGWVNSLKHTRMYTGSGPGIVSGKSPTPVWIDGIPVCEALKVQDDAGWRFSRLGGWWILRWRRSMVCVCGGVCVIDRSAPPLEEVPLYRGVAQPYNYGGAALHGLRYRLHGDLHVARPLWW